MDKIFVLAALSPPLPVPDWLSSLPPERGARISPSLPPNKVSDIVTAYRLLRHGLREFFSIAEMPEIALEEKGKPFFPGEKNPHFSLSHTDGGAMCALSAMPVGADIERARAVNGRLFSRICGGMQYDEENFFKEWTAREAAFKLFGEGSLLAPPVVPEGVTLTHFARCGFFMCVCGQGVAGEPFWVDDM